MYKRRFFVSLLIALNISILNYYNLCIDDNTVLQTSEDDELIDSYICEFDNDINYQFQNAYISRKRIDDMLKYLKNHYKFGNINNLSTEEIISKIIDNSINNNNDSFTSVFETADSLAYEQILKEIIDNIINFGTNDIDEDLYLIKNLKIVYSSDDFREQFIDMETNGIYYDNSLNSIIINRSVLFNKNEDNYSEEYYNTLRKNLFHIFNDIRQCYIDDYNKNYIKYSNLYNSSIMEDASTRYNKYYNKFNISYDEDVYKSYENDINSIILLSLYNKNATPEKYFDSLFDEDAKQLFDLLDLKSNDDIYKFYKILYSIDAKNYNNNFFEFFANYNTNKNQTMSDGVGYNYKLTLYDLYVKKLLNYIKDNNIDYKECLTLYYLGVNNLASDFNPMVDDSGNSILFNDVYILDLLNERHNTFKEFVSKYYKIPVSEIDYFAENVLNYNDDSFKNKYPMLKLINLDNLGIDSYKKIFNDDFIPKCKVL